eukprot:1791094-Pyramimonas_sp.AAC.1
MFSACSFVDVLCARAHKTHHKRAHRTHKRAHTIDHKRAHKTHHKRALKTHENQKSMPARPFIGAPLTKEDPLTYVMTTLRAVPEPVARDQTAVPARATVPFAS